MVTKDQVYRRDTGQTVKIVRVNTNPRPEDNTVTFEREAGGRVVMFVDQFLSRYTLAS